MTDNAPRARVAFYGDDFTGSVDVLLQFSRRGWTGRLFTALPDEATLRRAAAEVDVVGIAGIARSLPTADLAEEVLPALRALAALEPAVVQYKACSTADSSPEVGSIGRVVELGRAVFGDAPVPVLFAQPNFGRYTIFGNHFAREGETVHRLDRQPTMSQHPSTPMTESDLVVHLRRQTTLPVASLPFTTYASPAGIAARLAESPAAAVVLDAVDGVQVDLVGRAVGVLSAGRTVFAIGSGGLSTGLAAAWEVSEAAVPTATPASGPVLAVSGSRSAQTRRQVDAAAAAGWHTEPLDLADPARQAAVITRVLAAGRSVVVTSDDAGAATLERIAAAAASLISGAVGAGATRRVIVCGGDTSSRVTRLIGVESLSIAANPWGNVVLLTAHGEAPVDGVELLLKGGQVGETDLFAQVHALGD